MRLAVVLIFIAGFISQGADAQVAALKCDVKAVGSKKFAAQTVKIPMSPGRSLYVQVIKPAEPQMTTLMMLPGVNRNLLAEEEAAQVLAAQGFGVVTFSLSLQPFSIATLGKSEAPLFRSTELALKDFAAEAQAVAKEVAESFGITKLVPISLSYTGAVSPFMKGFPLIIEAVPMTSSKAANPELEKYREFLKAGELFNPIFGPAITRATLDGAYRKKWADQADSIIKQFKVPPERRDDMIEGYTMLSRAVEGFDWDDLKLPLLTRRVFMLAGNEEAELQRDQIEVFRKISKTRKDALMIVVLESGHVIPSDQPEAYACAIQIALAKQVMSGVVVIEPSTGVVQSVSGAAAEDFLNSKLNKLPKKSDD